MNTRQFNLIMIIYVVAPWYETASVLAVTHSDLCWTIDTGESCCSLLLIDRRPGLFSNYAVLRTTIVLIRLT